MVAAYIIESSQKPLTNTQNEQLITIVIPNTIFEILMGNYDPYQDGVYLSNVPIRNSERIIEGKITKIQGGKDDTT